MAFHFVSHQWEVQDRPDGTLVVFTPRDLDPVNLEDLVDELYELVRESGQATLYLDFGRIQRATSDVIGNLLALNSKLQQIGGRLVLCNVHPLLHETFQTANVTQTLEIRQDRV